MHQGFALAGFCAPRHFFVVPSNFRPFCANELYMGRPRRCIISKSFYEICFRTPHGLPFVATEYMRLIISGILARVQRDSKVSLCHFILMANHAHILIFSQDSAQCAQFHGEIKKQLSDALKALLGLPHLSLWPSNGSSIIPIPTLSDAIARIAYIYANPARANLVDSINHYPGLSSWNAFNSTEHFLSATHSQTCPWIRFPAIPKLPTRALTTSQDIAFTKALRQRASLSHDLTLHPNSWMEAFGISSPKEVAETNLRIKELLTQYEQDAQKKRSDNSLRTLGATKLATAAIDLTYRTLADARKIYICASDPELRKRLLAEYKRFCERCSYCYERWKIGDYSVEWPPGAYLPPIPQRINWLVD